MKNNLLETIVGSIVLLIAILFILFSFKIINVNNNKSQSYDVYAEFDNIEGINIGSDVKISGIKIGAVSDIKINKNYKAYLTLNLSKDYSIPNDSIFKISTSGLIGNKFIDVKIGSSDEYITNKDTVDYTESVLNLEDLISKFLFNFKKDENK